DLRDGRPRAQVRGPPTARARLRPSMPLGAAEPEFLRPLSLPPRGGASEDQPDRQASAATRLRANRPAAADAPARGLRGARAAGAGHGLALLRPAGRGTPHTAGDLRAGRTALGVGERPH